MQMLCLMMTELRALHPHLVDTEDKIDMLELARALAEDQEENKFLDADTSMPPAGSPAPVSVNRGKRDGGAIAEWCFCGVLRFSDSIYRYGGGLPGSRR